MTTNEKSASQATAELPKLPVGEIDVYFNGQRTAPAFTADQTQAYGLACYEAGRASRAQSELISEYDGLPLDAMPQPRDWRYLVLAAKCHDLLHLLSFADIKTPSEGDATEAAKVMTSIRQFINTEAATLGETK